MGDRKDLGEALAMELQMGCCYACRDATSSDPKDRVRYSESSTCCCCEGAERNGQGEAEG
jgi:hypothetical protein